MNTFRALCGITGGTATGALIGLLLMGLATRTSVCVLLVTVSLSVIGIEFCRLVARDRKRMRQGRDAVWQRREYDGKTPIDPQWQITAPGSFTIRKENR